MINRNSNSEGDNFVLQRRSAEGCYKGLMMVCKDARRWVGLIASNDTPKFISQGVAYSCMKFGDMNV